MKLLLSLLLISSILFSCQRVTRNPSETKDTGNLMFVDSTFADTVKQKIQVFPDNYFSNFKTPIEYRFFENGIQTDSIIQSDFDMTSWYSNRKDTISLVAHIGKFEAFALLLHFIDKKPKVFFFRAPHTDQNRFRINKADSFVNQIEVLPRRYELRLSRVPDTTNKPIIFGYIDMESGDYYDKRDSLQQPLKVQMKFYFRSQYRKFNY